MLTYLQSIVRPLLIHLGLFCNERATLARATLARATRVVIHSIFVLGPSALGTGKVTYNNLNLRNLRYNEKNLSRDVVINKIGICSNTSN